MFKLKNLLPKEVYKTVFDIDYNKLYEAGKRIILMDIDNTLVSYAESEPGEKLMALFKRIKEIGFEIIFISNNHKKRVETFVRATGSRYIENALKPFKRGYRKALKLVKPFGKDAIVSIGDQLVTDILGSNRFRNRRLSRETDRRPDGKVVHAAEPENRKLRSPENKEALSRGLPEIRGLG